MSRPSLRVDLLAGVLNFLAASYILVVNPLILSGGNTPTGMSSAGVLTATVCVIVFNTLLMGLYARLPYLVAPGMGVNAFFAYTLVLGHSIPWQHALGMVFWAGVLFLVLSLLPIREALVRAIPPSLRWGASAGIGMFLILIAAKNAGWVISDPNTLIALGPWTEASVLAALGFLLTITLTLRRHPLAFLLPILILMALWWWRHPETAHPSQLWSAPDFHSVFLKLDIWGALSWRYLPSILALMFTDFFDSISTFVGLAKTTELMDASGNPIRLKQGLRVDAIATLSAGLFGSSSGTAYLESATGILNGGKSGRTAVITALCFVPFLFLGPWAAVIPAFVTSPALFMTGLLMLSHLKPLADEKFEHAIDGWVCFALIPILFSITQGLIAGIIVRLVLVLLGKTNRLNS